MTSFLMNNLCYVHFADHLVISSDNQLSANEQKEPTRRVLIGNTEVQPLERKAKLDSQR